MSNMGYCRFQNTLSDLRDCYENMYDDVDKLSPEEKRARKKLIKVCSDIVDDAKFNGELEEDD